MAISEHQSDQAADAGFKNVLGVVYHDREAFRERHDAIFKTIDKGNTSTLAVTKLRFIRQDVAIADLDPALSGYTALPPGARPGADGALGRWGGEI